MQRFLTIQAALRAARAFRKKYGSRGYTYEACPDLISGRGYMVAVFSGRGVFLTYI